MRLRKGDLSARRGLKEKLDEIGQPEASFDQSAELLESREHERQKDKHSLAYLAAIIESSGDAIIGRTLDGIVTSWNHGAEILFGYTKDEMIGQPAMILVPPGDIERLKANRDKIHRGESIKPFETVRIRKDGKPVQVSITVSPVIDDHGKIIGASSIMRDIRKQKRAEEEIRALYDVNLAVTSTLDLPSILNLLLEQLDILFPYAKSYIRLLNKDTGKLERIACHNMNEQRWSSKSHGYRQRLAKVIMASKQPLSVRSMQTDDRIQHRDFYVQEGVVSFLGIPLLVRGEPIGTFALLTTEEHVFSKHEIRFAESLARQASVAIFNSQLYEESKATAAKLAEDEKQIRRLLVAQMNARDQERKQIAAAIHDDSGQLLVAVKMALAELAKGISPGSKRQIEELQRLVGQIQDRLRNMSREIHPEILDHLGIMPSLEFLAGQIARRTGMHFELEGNVNGRFAPQVELTVYRVVQEALQNVARHSQARSIELRLYQAEGLLHCVVKDDGVGFDPRAILNQNSQYRPGLGLAIARERIEALGGIFEIQSAAGQGAKLHIAIPHEKPNARTDPSS